MRLPALVDPFFRGKALLLVEDALTRRVLVTCWNQHQKAKEITVRPVGGHDSVRALVQAAREIGHHYVFGLVDRDFAGPSSVGSPLVRTERHEIENHLLDFNVLAKLSLTRSAAEIQQIANRQASSLQAWMAVRRTLHEMKQSLPGFPADPPFDAVRDLGAAAEWLKALPYPKNIEDEVHRTWTSTYLCDNRLPHHDGQCAADLTSGDWIKAFSGKEIFRHVRSQVPWRFPFEDDEGLAHKIALEWQRTNSTPQFIDTLRDAIIAGSGL